MRHGSIPSCCWRRNASDASNWATVCAGPKEQESQVDVPRAWLVLAYVAVLPSILGYMLWDQGVARAGATFSTSAAALATTVPSKKRGFCVPHNRTELVKVKSRKSSGVMSSSSTSS